MTQPIPRGDSEPIIGEGTPADSDTEEFASITGALYAARELEAVVGHDAIVSILLPISDRIARYNNARTAAGLPSVQFP